MPPPEVVLSAAPEISAWWRQAVVYQVYPRSFADADGDGIGDLAGILSRVPYLVELGVDAVWLSPFYPSALADGGYDVDDYRDVDPLLGSLEIMDELIAALHAAGIKVIVDVVPNHTSDRHEWFREALASPAGSAARDRYIFRDGLGPDRSQPPSDWESLFGGSAWHPVGDGQFYLHLFAPEQPDLNWDDRSVRDDFLQTLRFWSDRGVDGFRVDVAHGLAKNLAEPLPGAAAIEAGLPDGAHPLWDRDEVHAIYAEWRAVFDEYDPPRTAVAEAWVDSPARRSRYASGEGLGQAFNFDLLRSGWDAAAYRGIVADNLELAAASGSSSTWVLSNHDVVRHASRFGLPGARTGGEQEGRDWTNEPDPDASLDRALGVRRGRAATLLMLALPGSAYLYQGEELGLHQVTGIPADRLEDPTWVRSGHTDVGRDGCRVPLPWTSSGASFGFGPGEAHLPQPEWFAEVSVEAESADPESTLSLYREALRLRRELQGAETVEIVDAGADVVHLVRPDGWHSVTNFGTDAAPLPAGELIVASVPLPGDGTLPADATVWIRSAD